MGLRQVSDPIFSIETDLGYAEVYQYIKEYWIVILISIVAIKRKQIVYFSWSLFFTYLLFDDSLRIHEKFGHYVADALELQPMFQLRAQDMGELIVSLLSSLLLFSIIGASYYFSDAVAKQVSKHLFILIMLLAFFGVFVDMLHAAITWNKVIWGLVEDGGEMIIMSIIVWYVFSLRDNPSNHANTNANV